MSTSTRNRRAALYPLVGHSSGGFVTPRYGVARGSYWCRVSPVIGQESIVDAQIGVSESAIIGFADEVPVAENDLLVLEDDETAWKVGPITLRRQAREKILHVERSTEAPTFVTDQAAAAVSDSHVEGSHSDESFTNPGDGAIDGGGASQVVTETIDGGGA